MQPILQLVVSHNLADTWVMYLGLATGMDWVAWVMFGLSCMSYVTSRLFSNDYLHFHSWTNTLGNFTVRDSWIIIIIIMQNNVFLWMFIADATKVFLRVLGILFAVIVSILFESKKITSHPFYMIILMNDSLSILQNADVWVSHNNTQIKI